MPIFGLFGAFVVFVLAELAGNSTTRPATRVAFVMALLTSGGVGPAVWVRGALTAITEAATLIP
jgi:hypothetical protein